MDQQKNCNLKKIINKLTLALNHEFLYFKVYPYENIEYSDFPNSIKELNTSCLGSAPVKTLMQL